jgi:hypothetical protein
MASIIVAWTHGAEEGRLGQTISFERRKRVQHSGFRELCKTGLDWMMIRSSLSPQKPQFAAFVEKNRT